VQAVIRLPPVQSIAAGARKNFGNQVAARLFAWKMGLGMDRRKALQSEYGPGEILLFAAAGAAICFIAALVMLAH
jgi:hypothetical protein